MTAAKKDTTLPLPDTYDPAFVEPQWYDWWVKSGFFTPDAEQAKTTAASKKFVICIPPPNVTGYLHIGHALTSSVEDSLARWHRMRGDLTLYIPGTDHAGIATQSVVEKLLQKSENKTRHDLGRDAFLERVWEWKRERGGQICRQLTRLGSSLDWSREFFTMDDQLSTAVTEAFCRFYENGKIKRETRLINWCPHLRTALSDLEVDHEEIEKRTLLNIPGTKDKVEVGVICMFKYPVKGMTDTYLTVATTRLETMLGDVAVAVHPEDDRYAHLIGKELQHPFLPDRKMIVVGDGVLVDKEFGTGCVKITPAHDENDFKCGKRHNLPEINIFSDDGAVNAVGGEFAGLHRFVARRKVEERLKEMGLFVEKKDHKLKVPKCSRSGDIIEPMIKPQWFLNLREEAATACSALRAGDLRITPSEGHQVWFHYLENLRDWCISRQLWWGHRIPAYQTPQGKWYVGRTETEAKERAAADLGIPASEVKLEQDNDVLDTWFSSGLLPMSCLGWPNKEAADLKGFFPTQLLETGHDILFFWVARMVMMSLGLTGELPFKDVLLHAIIRDAHGRKMSKSLGNVIDPLEVIEGVTLETMIANLKAGNLPENEVIKAVKGLQEDFPEGIPKCGADALRFGLIAYTLQTNSINLDIKRIVGYRSFCNKIWNATKFAMENFKANDSRPNGFQPKGLASVYNQLSLEDKWILSRLSAAADRANKGFSSFQLHEATTASFNFWLYDFCDVYLELIKPRTREGDSVCLEVLYVCLDWGLRLLHPLLPFLTEELYQRLPACATKSDSICIAAYPNAVVQWQDDLIESEMELIKAVIGGFRSLAASLSIPPKERPIGFVKYSGEDVKLKGLHLITTLAKLSALTHVAEPQGKVAAAVVSERCTVYINIEGMDLSAETAKLEKKKALIVKQLEGVIAKRSVPNYDTKVPEAVRTANALKEESIRNEIKEIENAVAMFGL